MSGVVDDNINMLAGIGTFAALASEAELSTEGCGLLVDSCSKNLINISENDFGLEEK